MNTPEYTHTDPAALIGLAVIAWLIYAIDTIRKNRNTQKKGNTTK